MRAHHLARQEVYATSQLARPTQKNKYGFKFSQKKKSKETEREHQNMSVLALEIFGAFFLILGGEADR
jgi:DNA polymerase zeta